jgi:hypothetical protein
MPRRPPSSALLAAAFLALAAAGLAPKAVADDDAAPAVAPADDAADATDAPADGESSHGGVLGGLLRPPKRDDLGAEGTRPPGVPSDAELEAEGAVIGSVDVRVGDIFNLSDPAEHHRLYALANTLHRTTRDSVIENQLLFHPGDRYSRDLIDETERILRSYRFLYDARIRPTAYHDHRVDLEVVTRDVWTLNLGVGLGHAGGESSSRFLVQDTNLLGTGKSLTLEHTTDVDRDANLLRYDDPAVFGRHVTLGLLYSDTSDGAVRSFQLARPFYALETKWSLGLRADDESRVDTLYALGHPVDGFHHQLTSFELRGGLSSGLVHDQVRRWSAGFSYRDESFSAATPDELRLGDGLSPTAPPQDLTVSALWVGFDWIGDDFREEQNLDQLGRTEDLALGPQLHARLGVSSKLLGASRDELIFDAAGQSGRQLTPRQLLLLDSSVSGRWGAAGLANARAEGSLRWYWRDLGANVLFLRLEGAAARNLDGRQQLLLGGDSGLRGYPLRYQDGDERLLFTAEQRVFTRFYPFHLVHVGAAVFYDLGRTWGGDPLSAPQGWLQDVGFGLRLANSRSALGSVVHLDLAFPLGGDPSIQSVQWLVSTKASF